MEGCARDGRGHNWHRLRVSERQVSRSKSARERNLLQPPLGRFDGRQVRETCQFGLVARKALSRHPKKPNFVSKVARVCRVSRSKVQ